MFIPALKKVSQLSNIGVKELTKHVLSIAKREGYQANQFTVVRSEKVIFISFCNAFSKGLVRYDSLFQKNSTGGASSDVVKRIISIPYTRYVSFEENKGNEHLLDTYSLNVLIEDLLKTEAESKFYALEKIKRNEVYLESIDDAGEFIYPIWTPVEIIKFDGGNNQVASVVSSIPLTALEKSVIDKYLTLRNHEKNSISLEWDELMLMKRIDESLIDCVEQFGSYVI